MFNLPVRYSHSNFLGIIKDDVRVADKMPDWCFIPFGHLWSAAAIDHFARGKNRCWDSVLRYSEPDGKRGLLCLAWGI